MVDAVAFGSEGNAIYCTDIENHLGYGAAQMHAGFIGIAEGVFTLVYLDAAVIAAVYAGHGRIVNDIEDVGTGLTGKYRAFKLVQRLGGVSFGVIRAEAVTPVGQRVEVVFAAHKLVIV